MNASVAGYLKHVGGDANPTQLVISNTLASYRRAMNRFRVLPMDQLRGLPPLHPFLKRSGVYFLFIGSQLVYVGKSHNCAARVRQHTDIDFTSVKILESPDDLARAFERLFIIRYRPIYNEML